MNEESMWQAVHRMEDVAERAVRAAGVMEEAARRIAHLLEDGYGGNGCRLIELLEEARITTPSVGANAGIPTPLESGNDMTSTTFEFCCACGRVTGRAGKGEDSFYTDDEGPFCCECWEELGYDLGLVPPQPGGDNA